MTLIMVVFVIMAVFFIVMSWINKYSWLVALMFLSLAMAMYSVMMTIAIRGNYMPIGMIGYMDEVLFLNIIKKRISLFSITRIFNFSIALYISALVNFVPVYFNHFGKYDFKRWSKRIPAVIVPIFYIWFYDKQTAYWFYNLILFGRLSYDVLKCIDLLFNCIFLGYLVWPLVYIVCNWRNIKLKYKRKQVGGVLLFVISLDMMLLIIYKISYARKLYMFEPVDSLINVSGIIRFNETQYLIALASLFVLILLDIVVVLKFDIIPKRGILVRYYFAKDMQKINNNFFNMFHSVKKTIFMYKILAERALAEDGEKSKEILRQLIEEIDAYIARVSHMQQMNSEPEIFMEKMRISDIIEDAVSRYNNETAITIERRYESEEILVAADSFYLADVFDNILKNAVEAIKCKKDTGIIIISTECEHEWVIIRFQDNGEGIPKKEIKNAFKPLYTSKSRATNWGLGLSFSMKIVKIHMGHIYIENNPDEGATVNILLPRIS